MKIGVLALQGAVEPHLRHLAACGVTAVTVKLPLDLASLDGLILPGGESTTMLKLIDLFELSKPLENFAQTKPCFGFCAGAILMAREVQNPEQKSFGWLDISVRRNAYGRQLDSFNTVLETVHGPCPVSFIRAPRFVAIGANISVLAKLDQEAVWVRSGRHMAATCHPELWSETPSAMHRTFVESCRM